MRVFLDGGVDGLSLKVLIRETEIPWHHILLFAVLQLVVQFLQLEHEIIDHWPAIDLHWLQIVGDRLAEDHMPELLDHEELLQDGVYVADSA
jgi:hypothetical protein